MSTKQEKLSRKKTTVSSVFITCSLILLVLFIVAVGVVLCSRKHLLVSNKSVSVKDTTNCKNTDVVITWVNSEDLDWIKEYKATALEHNLSIDQKRFDCGVMEIEFSAKQYQKQSWVRTVYIVYAGSIPKHMLQLPYVWIPVSDILPSFVKQPCYNSNVIEMFVHTIPGLSENFVYSCDDMFIADDTSRDLCFTPDGQIRLNADDWGLDPRLASFLWSDTSTMSRVYTHELSLLKLPAFKKSVYYPLLYHGPVGINKTKYQTALDILGPDIVQESATHQFRRNDDVVFLCYFWPAYIVANNIGFWCGRTYSSLYIHLNDSLWLLELQLAICKRKKPAVICLNDSRETNFSKTSEVCRNFFQNYFRN